MKNSNRLNRNRNGATIILTLILLVVVFIFVAFAVDVGRIQLAQLKLQTAADFAARGGAEAMSRGLSQATDLDAFEESIRAEADMLMRANSLFGAPVSFDSNAQILFGISEPVRNSGAPTLGPEKGKKPKPPVGARGNGVTKRPHHGNGKNRYNFVQASGGKFQLDSNSISVNPDISQFPLVFGNFLGQDSVALRARATSTIQQRDIVVVFDRSGSMVTRDAGTIPIADYNANLHSVESTLYTNVDYQFLEESGNYNLTRVQALKMAILKFRNQIDETVGREQLGLITYSAAASLPSQVTGTPPTSGMDAMRGFTPNEFNLMTDGSLDKTHIASGLVGPDTEYANFDFNYIRTTCAGSTHIVDGIEKGVQTLFGESSRKLAVPVLIVMTDGLHKRESTPEAAATAAMALHPNLLIYTVTFGAGADTTTMKNVAGIGNGRHVHANTVADLVEAFEDIAKNAGVLMVE